VTASLVLGMLDGSGTGATSVRRGGDTCASYDAAKGVLLDGPPLRPPAESPSSITLSIMAGCTSGPISPSWDKGAARSQGPAPTTRPQNRPSKYYG
jgi:hypothetical protein